MGALSNHLLVVSILAYLLAMLGYAAEYAFGARSAATLAQEPAAQARPLVAVAAGAAPAAVTADAAPPGPAPTGPTFGDFGLDHPSEGVAESRYSERSGDPQRWWGRAAVGVTVLGALAHAGTLVARGLAAHRVPWGNMYEFVLAICLVGVITWLVLLLRWKDARHLGLLVTLALVMLLGFAGARLYAAAAPLVPALNSYWLKIHVTAVSIGSGILMIGFIAALLTLLRHGYESGRRGFPFALTARLPGVVRLERMTFRLHTVGFPIFTFAVIAGAIWAEAAWGRYWGWDPKETWSFITWVVYAGYLHARATPSVKRTVATWLAVAGWATMMFNLYAVNLVISGLHSYAGVK